MEDLRKFLLFIWNAFVASMIVVVFLYLVFWVNCSMDVGHFILDPLQEHVLLYIKIQETIYSTIPLVSCFVGVTITIVTACDFKLFDIRQTGK